MNEELGGDDTNAFYTPVIDQLCVYSRFIFHFVKPTIYFVNSVGCRIITVIGFIILADLHSTKAAQISQGFWI